MDIYYHSEKFKQLLRKYEELQENNISEIPCAEDLTDVAEYFHMLGEEEKALEVADYATRMYPSAVSPLAFKARMALLVDNNPQKADEIAESIIDKNDVDFLYLKAEIMIASSRPDDADKYLQA